MNAVEQILAHGIGHEIGTHIHLIAVFERIAAQGIDRLVALCIEFRKTDAAPFLQGEVGTHKQIMASIPSQTDTVGHGHLQGIINDKRGSVDIDYLAGSIGSQFMPHTNRSTNGQGITPRHLLLPLCTKGEQITVYVGIIGLPNGINIGIAAA